MKAAVALLGMSARSRSPTGTRYMRNCSPADEKGAQEEGGLEAHGWGLSFQQIRSGWSGKTMKFC